MKILKFDTWLKLNPDLVSEIERLADQDDDCAECDGAGEITCDECGYPHACLSCYGSGYKNPNHIRDSRTHLREMYNRQVEVELTKIAQHGVAVTERILTDEIPALEVI
jgi:hypothetical protein